MKSTLLLLLLVGARVSWGQAPTVGAGMGPEALHTFFTSPEKVLPRLYEAAIAHSGEVERIEATKDIAVEDIKLVKKRLLTAVALSSSYNYGTTPFYGGTEGASLINFNPFSYGARSQYSAGVNASLPLDLLFMRSTTIRRQELVLSQAVAQRKSVETAVHQQVINLYQALVLARAVQINSQELFQSASISKKIADKRFKEGEIQVDEQMAAQDLYGKAVLAQEESRNRYQTAQLLLEDLIGTSINNIMLGK